MQKEMFEQIIDKDFYDGFVGELAKDGVPKEKTSTIIDKVLALVNIRLITEETKELHIPAAEMMQITRFVKDNDLSETESGIQLYSDTVSFDGSVDADVSISVNKDGAVTEVVLYDDGNEVESQIDKDTVSRDFQFQTEKGRYRVIVDIEAELLSVISKEDFIPVEQDGDGEIRSWLIPMMSENGFDIPGIDVSKDSADCCVTMNEYGEINTWLVCSEGGFGWVARLDIKDEATKQMIFDEIKRIANGSDESAGDEPIETVLQPVTNAGISDKCIIPNMPSDAFLFEGDEDAPKSKVTHKGRVELNVQEIQDLVKWTADKVPMRRSGVLLEKTVEFENGKSMTVQCIGDGNGKAYSQAVLSNEAGVLATSESRYDFIGLWSLEYAGEDYDIMTAINVELLNGLPDFQLKEPDAMSKDLITWTAEQVEDQSDIIAGLNGCDDFCIFVGVNPRVDTDVSMTVYCEQYGYQWSARVQLKLEEKSKLIDFMKAQMEVFNAQHN